MPLQKAMEDLGFGNEEINDIFRIISAILKLGNLNFVPTTNMDGTEGCAISNDYGKIDFPFILGMRREFFYVQKLSLYHLSYLFDLSDLFSPRRLLIILLHSELHDVCHCLKTSYDKLSQVLQMRTIQLPGSMIQAPSINSLAISRGEALSPTSGSRVHFFVKIKQYTPFPHVSK